jgi:hypothetical protein
MRWINNKHGPGNDVGLVTAEMPRDGTHRRPRDETAELPRDGTFRKPRDKTLIFQRDGTYRKPRDKTLEMPRDGTLRKPRGIVILLPRDGNRKPRGETILTAGSFAVSYYQFASSSPLDARKYRRPFSRYREPVHGKPAMWTGKGRTVPITGQITDYGLRIEDIE